MGHRVKGLGRGLRALFGEEELSLVVDDQSQRKILEVSIHNLQSGRYQPRKTFDEATLRELALSIRAEGIISPIVVRPLPKGCYEIIAGERRFLAAQKAGLKTVPVVCRELSDRAALAVGLIENIQRENLNPLELASGIDQLIKRFSFDHSQCAMVLGCSRSHITNLLRLLKLCPKVQQLLVEKQIEMGHARALVTLSPTEQMMFAHRVVHKELNVRQLEKLLQEHQKIEKKIKKEKQKRVVSRDEERLQETLADYLGTKVNLQSSSKGTGKIVIHFANFEQLQGILDKMQCNFSSD